MWGKYWNPYTNLLIAQEVGGRGELWRLSNTLFAGVLKINFEAHEEAILTLWLGPQPIWLPVGITLIGISRCVSREAIGSII